MRKDIFSKDYQERAAQSVIDWLEDFFQWETYDEQEIDELGMLHDFPLWHHWGSGELKNYLKERFTPRNPMTQMLTGHQGEGAQCPIANTIRRGFPNFNKMIIEVSSETISIEDAETYEIVNIPCQDSPVALFVQAFDAGLLPMYQRKEEWEGE